MVLPFNWQFAVYNLSQPRGVAGLIVTSLLVGLFTHWAARMVIKKDDIHQGFVAGVYGMLAGMLCRSMITVEVVAFIAALAAFCVVVLAVYRVKFPQAIAVGAVAWVLWIVANIVMAWVMANFAN